MPELPVPRAEIDLRLKKVEGQVRGIRAMVEGERDCVEIIIQLAAVKAALESVVGQVLKNYTVVCLSKKDNCDIGTELAHAVSIWVGGKS